MTDTLAAQTSRITAGPWKHRGSIIVSFQIANGQVETVRIPEDLVALQARVTALEARVAPNSLEDLTYAG
jgi:hypothetical protein